MSTSTDALHRSSSSTNPVADNAIAADESESHTTTEQLASQPTSLERRFGESFASPTSAFTVASSNTPAEEAAAARIELRQSSLATEDERRAAVVEQLRVESRINEPVNPEYAGRLRVHADQIASGERTLPPGDYLPREISEPRLATEVPNWLPVPTLSSSTEQVVARITEIEAEIADIARFTAGDVFRGIPGAAGDGVRVAQLQAEKNMLINAHRMQPSRGENAEVYRALSVEANVERPAVIFVNGINTDANRASLQALELSDAFDSPVDHVVNVSDVISGASSGGRSLLAEGTNREAAEVRIQQHVLGNRPAAVEAANLVLEQMYDPALRASDTPVKIVGYSQGSAISSQALRDVESYLQGEVEAGRLATGDKEAMLDRVRFLGIGPSVDERHIDRAYIGDGQTVGIDALSDIDYRVILDGNDPITLMNGVGEESTNLGVAAQNGARVVNGDLFEHLSYFEQYDHTDPGSNYNPRTANELEAWFNGTSVRGIVDIAP